TVDIRIDVANQRGVLATIAATIADVGSNIENVKMADRTDGNNSTIDLVITVEDRRHLARLIRRVKQVPQVLRIARMKS
ncbi:MAG: ACT domain-containing protein, partial [Anaerolineae bacterium]|nr:ACT domain-containing protein [Anaerolineae bacterium]